MFGPSRQRPRPAISYVPPTTTAKLEVVFTASSSTLDGRFANNGWMQETPDFLTKLTWDNAALVAPATAEDLGLEHGKFARIEVAGRKVEGPVYVMPGQAPWQHRAGIGLRSNSSWRGRWRRRERRFLGRCRRESDSATLRIRLLPLK